MKLVGMQLNQESSLKKGSLIKSRSGLEKGSLKEIHTPRRRMMMIMILGAKGLM